jgi:2-iminobutanoate/2-iminopropanoate deaminase
MSAERQAISTAAAPAVIGPYSQAIRVGHLLFLSGQVALDPETGALISGGVAAQTDRILLNLDAVLRAAGSSLAAVAKTTVYLVDLEDFSAMNEVYAAHFPEAPPARATIQVSRLPRDARVEIDAIAVLP